MINEASKKLFGKAFEIKYIFDESAPNFMRKSPEERRARHGMLLNPNLNPNYTFENFVVGSCNTFAHAACTAVAKNPARSYNPLYIYGGSGLGKTHLMNAIGHQCLRNDPRLRIIYTTTERFMNEVVNHLQYGKILELREKYRSVDLLLMDDIHTLVGKDRTKEEFFHTFNHLYDNQKQIVISSDCPPKEISGLEERYQSRFEWGLIADKAVSNIRELEGYLRRVVAFASLKGEKIELDLAKESLKDLVDASARIVTVEKIQKLVCHKYKIKLAQLKAKNNSPKFSFPRQIAMYLAKELTDTSLPEIGKKFGGKHHTTVLHSVRKIEKMREGQPEFDKEINSLIHFIQ